jgi:MerR family transcriptional regulator, light-induced transcriptional regulator
MRRAPDLQSHVGGFVDVLVAHDLQSARDAVTRLRTQGADIEALYTELFAPSLHLVGELWAAGKISVAEERVASSLVEQMMAALYPDMFVTRRASRERVLVAAPEGERHVIGLRMVADVLESHGYDGIFLGADTPRAEISRAVRRYTPHLVVLAAYTAQSVDELAAAINLLSQSAPHLPILVGGASDAIHGAVEENERIAIVKNIADARAVAEQAMGRATPAQH